MSTEVDTETEYHIPILLSNEIIPLLSNPLDTTSLPIDEWNQQYLLDLKIHDVGIGRSSAISGLTYVIIYSPRLQKFRNQYHLSPLDLYISIPSIALKEQDQENCDRRSCGLRHDILTLCYHHSLSSYHHTLQKILSSPANPTVRSYLHYDYLIQQLRSSGLLSGIYFYAKEVMRPNPHSLENLQVIYNLFEEIIHSPTSCLKHSVDHENYGELVAQILNSNLKYSSLGSHKLRRFYQSTEAPLHSESQLTTEFYSISFTNMPRNFSLVCDSLYGSSLPTTSEQLSCWRAMGITNIITVMEEPLPKELQQSSDLNFHHFAVVDRHAPSLKQIHSMMTLLGQLLHPSHDNPSKKQVVVHCLGGVGRTATVLCCYLMRFQKRMSREIAQSFLLTTRKTIFTSQQEEILQRYYQDCLSSPYIFHSPLHDATSLHPTVTLPSVILCIGFPAAGKSTFCETLVKAFPHLVMRIHQKEDLLLLPHKGNHSSFPQVKILDQCNLRREERIEWLSSLRGELSVVWYLHFDLSAEECQWRLSKLTNQSMSKSGKGSSFGQRKARVLVSEQDSLEDPCQDLERYQKLFKISNLQEANHLLSEWGVPSSLLPLLSSPSPGAGSGGAKAEMDAAAAETPTKMIIKFPRTRHVYNLGSATRDDLILSSDDAFKQFLDPSKILYIEEKIDGANLGISIQHFPPSPPQLVVQNRSHYVSSGYHAQFKCLDQWLAQHSSELWEILQYSDRFILYGEWVYARHSIAYTHLPDYFIAFDYFDQLTQQFYSRDRLTSLLKNTSIHQIHLISSFPRPSSGPSTTSVLSKEQLVEVVCHQQSKYYNGCVEGVYLRTMTPDNQWLLDRGKIVRSDFIAGNEFWSKGGIHPNQIDHQQQRNAFS